ncbi:hypothetical protein BV25DRAFT_1922402 [Artomyces pyxidatus]|uniref:Uncharacterized protein n=1 Tax=Artomyces pyxidatus TaxID=48021 RepID=A0ACB8SFR5_9AGAM|nr:hypothetical protein BV25DRAFT_1922402 [Artomyces pyxidatus]
MPRSPTPSASSLLLSFVLQALDDRTDGEENFSASPLPDARPTQRSYFFVQGSLRVFTSSQADAPFEQSGVRPNQAMIETHALLTGTVRSCVQGEYEDGRALEGLRSKTVWPADQTGRLCAGVRAGRHRRAEAPFEFGLTVASVHVPKTSLHRTRTMPPPSGPG